MKDRKQKTLMKGIGLEIVLAYPDETQPYHRVYILLNGVPAIGLHESELFDIGTELIAAHGEIYEPELMARA
jgi:hypothetical protein